MNVGTEADMPLQSIKPTGADVSDNIVIQTLDAYGRTVDSYLWIDWAGDESDQDAWVNDETYEIIDGVSFEPGTGLWIQGTSTEQGIQNAGKVSSNDLVVSLRSGNSAICNPFPVTISLQDIIATGSDVSDNVVIQTLDAYGRTVDSYLWIDWAGDESDQEAWVNDETYEIIEGVSFEAGAGLWVQGTSSEQSLRFPAPEL